MILTQRLSSLDAFRGLTIICMIIVNNPGSWDYVYPPLLHAKWNGCTPTDLIFPFFLFILGFSISLSTEARLKKGAPKRDLISHHAKRSAIILLIGLLLNAYPFNDLENFRISGVLQRISLVNFACGVIHIYSNRTFRLITSAVILIGYWILLCFLPFPSVGAPSLAMQSNWSSWVDSHVFVHHAFSPEPEGVLSTLPAIVTGLLGIEIAELFTKIPDQRKRTAFLLVSGVILTLLGLAWSTHFPFNKKLWTSSYVLFTAGLANLIFGGFYWLIDDLNQKKWAKLQVAFGQNPLALYVGSEFVMMTLLHLRLFGQERVILQDWFCQSLVNIGLAPVNASLAWALLSVSFWSIIAWILYERKIVIKV